MARDTECRPGVGRGGLVGEDLAILNRFDQTQSEHLERHAEREVALRVFRLEIGLSQLAARNRGIVRDSADGPELMDASVSGAIGLELEAHFKDRPVLLLERRHDILLPETVRDQAKLRILRSLRNR